MFMSIMLQIFKFLLRKEQGTCYLRIMKLPLELLAHQLTSTVLGKNPITSPLPSVIWIMNTVAKFYFQYNARIKRVFNY